MTADVSPAPDAGGLGRPEPIRLGRYAILDVLGVGGMGVVYTAYDPKLDRKVAIKLVREREGGNRSASLGRARLVREAQTLAKLSHPNIVTVHDVDIVDERLYLAMEFVDGHNLDDWLAESPRSLAEITNALHSAGQGLRAAHAAGIVHRDFKPGNILVGRDGRVRVVDFGLAKHDHPTPSIDGDRDTGLLAPLEADLSRPDGDVMRVVTHTGERKLTGAGRIVGTPDYMAPEQQTGEVVGPAADQFSFGVTLYEALYGYKPFDSGPNKNQALENACEGNIRPVPRDGWVPTWMHRVIVRALAPKPDDRFATMDELLTALRADPAKRRRRWIIAAVATVATAGAAVGAVLVWPAAGAACAEGHVRLAEIWSDGRRAEVASSLRATGTPYAADAARHVVSGLDTWGLAWVDARREVCEATHVHHEQSEALFDVRMRCLAKRSSELDALLDVLVAADPEVAEQAVSAVYALDRPEFCASERAEDHGALPRDSDAQLAVETIERALDQIKARLDAGKYAEAASLAAEAVEHANELDDSRTLARARLLRGIALDRTHAPGAQSELEAAVTLSAAAWDARLETEALIELAYTVGVSNRRPEQGLLLRVPARAALIRTSDAAGLGWSLASVSGGLLLQAERFDEAIVALEDALVLTEAAGPASSPARARILANLGVANVRGGHPEAGRKTLLRALAMAEDALGPHHPAVAAVLLNLGNAERASDLTAAIAHYDRALAIRASVFGDDHPKVAEAHASIANALAHTPERSRARAEYEVALTSLRGSGNDASLAAVLNNLGRLEIDEARFDAAFERFAEASQILERARGTDDIGVGRAKRRACEALLEGDQPIAAKRWCAEALAILRTSAPPAEVAAVQAAARRAGLTTP